MIDKVGNPHKLSGERTSPVPTWTPRQVLAATLVVLLVVFGFWFLYRFRLVIFGLFEAIVFSTALRPMVSWLQRRGVPRAISAALLFLLLLAMFLGLVFLFVPLFTEQSATISGTLVKYYQEFHQTLMSSSSMILNQLAYRLPNTIVITPPGPAPSNPSTPLDQVAVVFSFGQAAIRGAFVTLTLLLLTFYYTADRERILRSMLFFLPAERREPTRQFIEASEEKVGAYLRGLAIMCGTIGLLQFTAYTIIGLPYTALLGVTAGLFEAVPLLGPILGALPAVLIALALDPTKVIWVILSTILIQQFENHILVPRVMDQSVGVNPVVGLLAFVVFSSLFGMAGALLAIPLAATLQLVFNRALFVEPEQPPAGRDTISMLRYEAQELILDVRKQVRQKETAIDDPSDQVEDAIEAIVNDLDSILAKAEQVDLQENKVINEGAKA